MTITLAVALGLPARLIGPLLDAAPVPHEDAEAELRASSDQHIDPQTHREPVQQ